MAHLPAWDTSSDGAAAETRPLDLAALEQHCGACLADSGSWITLRFGAGWLQDFLGARLVTTAAVLAAGAVLWLVWR